MTLIERDRVKAIEAMRATKYADGRVNLGDALDAALDSGALVWADTLRGAVEALKKIACSPVNIITDEGDLAGRRMQAIAHDAITRLGGQ